MSILIRQQTASAYASVATLDHASIAADDARFEQLKQWGKALLYVSIIFAVMFFVSHAMATDGTEFKEASTKFEGWVKGNLGKVAALICVAIGMLVAAVRKDYQWLLGGVALGMLVGIIVGIINSSFTATI